MDQMMQMLVTVGPFILLIAVYYFLLIRPQQKKQKKITEMRDNVKVGDRVITIGGFIGKVVNVKDEDLTIECGSDKCRLTIARWGISAVVDKD